MTEQVVLCECGCGKPVNWYRGKPNRFIKGHHARGRHNPMWGKQSAFKRHSEETKQKLAAIHQGKRLSPETRQKISETRKARIKNGTIVVRTGPHSEKTKCKIGEKAKKRLAVPGTHHMSGKHHSKSTRAKIADALRGRYRGPNHPNWRGGSSRRDYHGGFTQELKGAVRQRDGYTCQLCGRQENDRIHHCHHIDYDKGNNEAENLITLCASCHSMTNFGRSYWQALFVMRSGIRLLPNLAVELT